MSEPLPFKICIIGCGGIATSQHGPAYARYAAEHPYTELSACCDIDEGKAREYARRFGFRRAYTDFEQMLATEKPNAACLNVPPDRTAALSSRILSMGFPLLLEKPPGLTVAETDTMIQAAEESNVPHQVAFNRRFTPLARVLKVILSGEKGGKGEEEGLKSPLRIQNGEDWIQHIQYELTRVGRTDADFSTTAIHGIDTVRFLAGYDYAQIAFHYQDFYYRTAKVTNIFMDCTLVSGATAHLSFMPASGAVLERATIHLQDHVFFMHLPVWNGTDAPGLLRWLSRGQVQQEWSGPDLSATTDDYALNGFWDEDASFFDDIRNGRRPSCDLQSARQSVEIAQCLRERRAVYHGTTDTHR